MQGGVSRFGEEDSDAQASPSEKEDKRDALIVIFFAQASKLELSAIQESRLLSPVLEPTSPGCYLTLSLALSRSLYLSRPAIAKPTSPSTEENSLFGGGGSGSGGSWRRRLVNVGPHEEIEMGRAYLFGPG